MDPIIDIRDWNKIVAAQPHSPFLQSYEWGEFQKSVGQNVERLVFYHEKKISAVVQIFIYALGGGLSYFSVPHGPIGELAASQTDDLQREIQKIQKRTKSIFLRWEPKKESNSFFLCRKQRKAKSIQPRTTLIIELHKTEQALLDGMHPKTRYNIRVAGKHGVEIRVDDAVSSKVQNDFLLLLKETARRDHFHLHEEAYYRKLLESFQKKLQDQQSKPFIRLYTAWVDNQMLAGGIVLFFGDTATYLHGASSLQQRNVMAPHALHWHILQEAKKLGYQYYDFWGIAENYVASHPWAGLTRFKKGFGGTVTAYPPARDCIFSPFLYTLYVIAKATHKTVKYLHP